MLPADLFEDRPGNLGHTERMLHRRFIPIVIALSEWANRRVTWLALQKTNFIFCGERQRADFQAGLLEFKKCFLRRGSPNGARRQVEDSLDVTFRKTFEGWE